MRGVKIIIYFILLFIVVPTVSKISSIYAFGRKEKTSMAPSPVNTRFKQEVDAQIDKAGDEVDCFINWIHGRFESATRAQQISLNRMLFFLGASIIGDSVSQNVGPVTLVVTDNETGLPLKDITVYYQLRKRRVVSIQQIENPAIALEELKSNIKNYGEMILPVRSYRSEFPTVAIEKLMTDVNGEIYIPIRNYSLELTEDSLRMFFFINLDTNDNRIAVESDMYRFYDFSRPINDNIDSNIVLADKKYCTTYVTIYNIIDNGEREMSTEGSDGNILYYSFAKPFLNEIRLSAKLARNTD